MSASKQNVTTPCSTNTPLNPWIHLLGGTRSLTETQVLDASFLSSVINLESQLEDVALQMMQQMGRHKNNRLKEAIILHDIAAIRWTRAPELSNAEKNRKEAKIVANRHKDIPKEALKHLKDRVASLKDLKSKQNAQDTLKKAEGKRAKHLKSKELHTQAIEDQRQLHETLGLAALEEQRIEGLKKGSPVDGTNFEQFCVQLVKQAMRDAGMLVGDGLSVVGGVTVENTNLSDRVPMSNTKMEFDILVIDEDGNVLWLGEVKHNAADVLHDLKALSRPSDLINHHEFEWIDLVIPKGAGTTRRKIRVTRAGLTALLGTGLPGMTYMTRRDTKGLKDLLLPPAYSNRLFTTISEHEMFSPELIIGFATDPSNWEQAASQLAAASVERMISISDWLSEGQEALIKMVQAGAVLSVDY